MLKIIIPAIIIVGFSMAAIAIKMFIKKDGEFKKSCSSVDPNTGQRIGCTCGNEAANTCDNR